MAISTARSLLKSVRIDGRCRAASAQPGRLGPFGECLVAVVAPEHVGCVAGLERRTGEQQVEIAVVVVIDKRDSGRLVARRQAGFRRHVLELSLAQIAEQQHLVVERDGQIVQVVAIVVANGAGNGVASMPLSPAAAASTSSKLAIVVAMQHANRLRPGLHQHQVHLSGAGHVEHAGATVCRCCTLVSCGHRLCHQLHGNHRVLPGFRLFNRRDRRVVTLLSVGQADGRGDLGAGQVLKALEVLLRFRRLARCAAARAPVANSAEACRGLIASACLKISMALSNCFISP